MGSDSISPELIANIHRNSDRARREIKVLLAALERAFPDIEIAEERDDGLTVAVALRGKGVWVSKHCPAIAGRPIETCVERFRAVVARLGRP